MIFANKIRKNKRGIELETIAWWLIGIVVLTVSIIVIIILRGKGSAALAYIKDLITARG